MAADTFYFQGPCKWAKVYKPDMKFEPGSYSIDIGLDEEAEAQFKEIGLRNKIKEDEDGRYAGFKRKLGKKPWAPDEDWGPPEVVDAKGQPFKELIGNGSIVAIELVVYDTVKFGKGSRLEKVVVVKHVPYEKDDTPADGEEAPPKEEGAKAKPKGLPF